MNLRHLKYFVATAESGQVSKAASMMNITQSAITSAIKEIEVKLGVKLFLRSSRGMELTGEGHEFLRSSYEILSNYDRALKLTKRSTTVSGNVRLAVSYTVVGYFLPWHLGKLKNIYPNLHIEIYETNREIIEEGLLNHRYDLAIVLTSNTSNQELQTETLHHSVRRLWLPYGHALAEKSSVSFAEIAKEPYIMLTVDEAAHTAIRYWSKTEHRPNIRVKTSSIEAVRSMVANGEGVTILSDMVYRPWSLEGKRIVTTATNPEPPPMSIGLAWQKYLQPHPASNALMKYFRSVYSGNAASAHLH